MTPLLSLLIVIIVLLVIFFIVFYFLNEKQLPKYCEQTKIDDGFCAVCTNTKCKKCEILNEISKELNI